MNKIFKAVSAAAAAIALSAAMTLGVSATQDYEFDVSGVTKTLGEWNQSVTVNTACIGDPEFADNFNPTWMTPDSEVLVEFEVEDIPNGYPCELIWQTWGDTRELDPNIKSDWTKIEPVEADMSSARFTYESIVNAYGSDDFSKVYAIHIGDMGSPLLVTKLTITNIDVSGSTDKEASAAEEETKSASEGTEAPESESSGLISATSSIADNAPDESGISATVIIVIVVVVVVAAAAVFIAVMIKKSKNSLY